MVKRLYIILIIGVLLSCEGEPPLVNEPIDLTDISFNPTEITVNVPAHFPRLEVPPDNPMTEEGVILGRHLFYDPILSLDSTISCSSCHAPEHSFTDINRFSLGVDGTLGNRQSMSLLNVAFTKRGLFWDGRTSTLEEQALLPIEDPTEMKNTWEEVEERLQRNVDYQRMFRKAFGISTNKEITRQLAVKALAQFERTIVSSGMSRYDQIQAGLDVYTDQELLGRDLFFDDNPDIPDAECGHCHNVPISTSDDFFNNGLTETNDLNGFPDLGRGEATGIISDHGKFKAPSLRNIGMTAPYMHDGRFNTLDEVIEHYNNGGNFSPNRDANIRPLGLTPEYKAALKAFILTFSEPDITSRQDLLSPF